MNRSGIQGWLRVAVAGIAAVVSSSLAVVPVLAQHYVQAQLTSPIVSKEYIVKIANKTTSTRRSTLVGVSLSDLGTFWHSDVADPNTDPRRRVWVVHYKASQGFVAGLSYFYPGADIYDAFDAITGQEKGVMVKGKRTSAALRDKASPEPTDRY
jgi:hypothetical protein